MPFSRLIAGATLLAGALFIVGCGGGDSNTSQSNAETTPQSTNTGREQEPEPKRKGISVKSRDSEYGRILYDGSGQAIYLFTKESTSKPDCYGDCARAWPPVLTKGEPRARSGVRQTKLGTTKRRDGKTQVTYNDHPLYYYVDDPVNEVLCQAVSEFGGLWYVVAPSGEAVT